MRRLVVGAGVAAGIWLAGISSGNALNVPSLTARADLVLGQPDFTSATSVLASATSLREPSALLVDPASGKLFVADTDNNRVLRYASAEALRSGDPAEAAFGQSSLTASGVALPAAQTLNSPVGLALDPAGRMWVADADNHRVLMFSSAATAVSGSAATLVLGQATFGGGSAGLARNRMDAPSGLWIDPAGRLWVADRGNNRVLRFDNAAQKASGADADGVLGQPNFETKAPGSGNQQLDQPAAVTVDASGTLWVADSGNNRVFGYPSAATISNGTNAARVLGQPNFSSTSPGTSASLLRAPTGVFADARGDLWVLDTGNHRALRFAGIKSLQDGRSAAAVVGQSTFDAAETGTSTTRLANPFVGLFVEPDADLWLSDLGNHRVLRFRAVDDERPTIALIGRSRFTTRRPRVLLRGTARDDVAVTEVLVQSGPGAARRALIFREGGATRWRRNVVLPRGRNRITVVARDATGKRSPRLLVLITRL